MNSLPSDPTAVASKSTGKTRKNQNHTVDFARLIMAFGVIAIHAKYDTKAAELYNNVFWPVAVPFFFISSLTYFITSLEKRQFLEQAKKAYSRLVIPYLTWTVIYSCLLWGKAFMTGGDRPFVWWRVLFYGESSVQLYFIPTLLCFQTLALASYLLLYQPRKIGLGLSLLVGCVAYLVIGDVYDCFGVSASGQYLAIPAYLIAAFLLAPHVKKVSTQPLPGLMGLGIALVAIGSNLMGFTYPVLGYPMVLPLAGISFFLFCIGFPTLVTSQKINKLATTSFGIYLAHVIFLEAFEFLIEKGFHDQLQYDFWVKTLVVSAIFGSSILLVLVSRKSGFMRGLLFGEK